MSNSKASEDRIRDEAYRLWEAAGRPHSRDSEFWHQASAMVDRELSAPVKVAAAAAKPSKKAAKSKVAESPPRRRSRKAGTQPTTPSA